jgi:hypothetical protein
MGDRAWQRRERATTSSRKVLLSCPYQIKGSLSFCRPLELDDYVIRAMCGCTDVQMARCGSVAGPVAMGVFRVPHNSILWSGASYPASFESFWLESFDSNRASMFASTGAARGTWSYLLLMPARFYVQKNFCTLSRTHVPQVKAAGTSHLCWRILRCTTAGVGVEARYCFVKRAWSGARLWS